MQLVEQHVIAKGDPRYAVIDAAAFVAKNLYNAALYTVRQTYIFQGHYLCYQEMDKQMQEYKALPAKVAQQVLKGLDHNWQSFFAARKAYQEGPRSSWVVLPCPNTSTKPRGGTCWSTPTRPSAEKA